MHSSKKNSRLKSGHSLVPTKVTWQLVKAVDRRTKQQKILLIGKPGPDVGRFVRANLVRDLQNPELPLAYRN